MQYRTRRFVAVSMAVLLGMASGCGSANKSPIGMTPDTVAPNMIATNPVTHGIGMAVTTAAFSEAMDASTITPATFAIVGPDGTSVLGGLAYDASTDIARFSPAGALVPGATVVAPTVAVTSVPLPREPKPRGM
jgi:Big-like domain-containing protein